MALADLDVNSDFPAYYEGQGGGDRGDDDDRAVVVFRYVAGDVPADADRPPLETDVVTSHAADDLIEWDDAEGTQAVAQAILRHFTGEEPDQALLEALITERGDDWVSGAAWTVTIDELDQIV